MSRNKTAIDSLLADSREYWVPSSVRVLQEPPDPLTFLRDYVSQSEPLIIRSAASSWRAVSKWTLDYLTKTHGDLPLSVSLTPDGHADAITSNRFAQPLIETWDLSRLLHALTNHIDGTVPYYAAQNSCLTDEAAALCDDVDFNTIQFARDALGVPETAVNLWIGDERSVSTMHADPFHNLYVVVRGRKTFTLRPPSDAAFLPKPRCRDARWTRKPNGEWILSDAPGATSTRWIPHGREYPGRPLIVHLNVGDLFYMPPLWCTFGKLRVYATRMQDTNALARCSPRSDADWCDHCCELVV